MEKEEAEQDEKDYDEMRKAVPGVAKHVVEYAKKKKEADEEAQNARISKWERRVLRTHPPHRGAEPEKEEEVPEVVEKGRTKRRPRVNMKHLQRQNIVNNPGG